MAALLAQPFVEGNQLTNIWRSTSKHRETLFRTESTNPISTPGFFACKKPKATWVEPSFTAEVEYRDITSEGLLRQSSFKGLTKRDG
jgi:ATP-dependent DNA ligase